MGQALARLDDVQTLNATQRAALAQFLDGLKVTVTNLVTTFTTDTQAMSGNAADAAGRVLTRARTLVGNINFEIAQLADVTQSGDSWWNERVASVRQIISDVQTLSADMVGFLETGHIPSEDAARRQMWLFGGVAIAIGALSYYLWWLDEKRAEEEQTRAIESGELEDCGCTG